MADVQQTISVPSLLIVAAIGALAVRYFFFTSDSPSNPGSGGSRAANPTHVDQIANMFPQIPRRSIIWDLQHNGGNVSSTTERILNTGGLDTPPPTFQPVMPNPAATSSTSSSILPKGNYLNLINKYNLSDKVKSPASTPTEGTSSSQPTWSADRQERQALLQRRREEMILKARRKMEEKEQEQNAR